GGGAPGRWGRGARLRPAPALAKVPRPA
ncbi:hypothetical protein IAE31_005849, partial [Pseudomonas sp. S68]|nr:hypothetical protein [Pseudomonas sp. S68]